MIVNEPFSSIDFGGAKRKRRRCKVVANCRFGEDRDYDDDEDDDEDGQELLLVPEMQFNNERSCSCKRKRRRKRISSVLQLPPMLPDR